jgi:glycosyltransferase involved in cell wall biosynthesis
MSDFALSAIVLCHNERRHIPSVVACFAQARGLVGELIFVDDGSQDGSLDLLLSQRDSLPPLRVIRHNQAQGIAAGIAAGLAAARGRYVFLGAADDPTDPALFAESIALLQAHPEAGLCSALSGLLDEDGTPRGVFPVPLPLTKRGYLTPADCARQLLRLDSWIMGNTCIYRRDALLSNGGMDDRLLGLTDAFAAWTLALQHGACFIPRVLGHKRNMEGGYGSSLHDDDQAAEAVWQHTRSLMSGRFKDAYPPALVRRMERRWRFNIARRRSWRRWGGASAGLAARLSFLLARIVLALRWKIADIPALMLRRRRLRCLLDGGSD